jgi:hypothetical protein
VQCAFHVEPPSRVSIYAWCKKFEQKGCICKGKSPGRSSVSDAAVDRVRACFQHSPQKSTHRASRELQLPRTTVPKILLERLLMKPYKLQLVQALKPDLALRYELCREILARIENDNDLPAKFVSSDEATFHINGKVNRHNVRVWGTKTPHVNVFCAIWKERVSGPFLFVENAVTGNSYLDMLTLWLLPQVEEDSNDFIFQQDGAPPHFHVAVRNHLNVHHPRRWIGRAAANDVVWCSWPPRSPDLIPCDFLLWGYTKDKVFVPLLPRSLPELRLRITTAIVSITRDTAQSLGRVGLSSRHLPCDSQSTYPISARCKNFERFSIDWCRCEVLSTPHLFSVSFWKCKVLLCSLCIYWSRSPGFRPIARDTNVRFQNNRLSIRVGMINLLPAAHLYVAPFNVSVSNLQLGPFQGHGKSGEMPQAPQLCIAVFV